MNANQIHLGSEYAIAPYGKPNGNPVIPNAIRLVAYRTFGEQEYGNKRLTMFVEGFRLDPETGQPISNIYYKYRVRDVIDDYEEYQDRMDQHEVEQARINKEREERYRLQREEQERYRREREEHNRIERDEREKQRQVVKTRLNFVVEGLVERGLNRESITVDEYGGNATVTLVELERWLKLLIKVECGTCYRELIILDTLQFGG